MCHETAEDQLMKKNETSNRSTCREGELYLLIDDFHGDKVMFLIEAAVVEQQTVGLFGSKSEKKTKQNTKIYFIFIEVLFVYLAPDDYLS